MDQELSDLLDKLKRANKGKKKRKNKKVLSGNNDEDDVGNKYNNNNSEEEGSAFLKAKARVEQDRIEKMFPTILTGSWLYKYPSEGSKASAASSVETYPRKCLYCSTWLSSKTSYEQHLLKAHSNKSNNNIYNNNNNNNTSSTGTSNKNGNNNKNNEHVQQLGIPRKYFFKLDTKNNQINWYFNETKYKKDEKNSDPQIKIAGSLALDSVIKISVGVATPGVEMPKPEFINDYFTLQAKGRYVVLRASNAPNAHSWVRELRVAVFELGQPPPGDDASETLFSLINNKGNNLKNDESVTGMAIERLVSNNPDMLNIPNEDGDTPLIVAVRLNLSHVVQILLSLGANLSLLGKRNNSVLHVACKNAGMMMKKTEMNNMNHKDDAVDDDNHKNIDGIETYKIAMKIIEILLDIPFVEKILDVRREGGATCVHDIASAGNVHILQLLLEKNANPYSCDDYDRTALHIACSQQETAYNTQVVSLLCELIEDTLDWQDFEGNTALHLAARIGNFNAVQQLLQTAANPSIKNKAGATPYDISLASNYEEIASIIEEYNIIDEQSNAEEDDEAYEEEDDDILENAKGNKQHYNDMYYNNNNNMMMTMEQQSHQYNNQMYNVENTSPYNNNINNNSNNNEKGPANTLSYIHPQASSSYYHHSHQYHQQQRQQAWVHQVNINNNKNLSDTSASGYSMSEREWGEAITEDGRRYYFNTVTGHTQWEVPIGWQQQLGGMQQQQQQQPSTAIINNSANNNNNSNNSNNNISPNHIQQQPMQMQQPRVRYQQQTINTTVNVGNNINDLKTTSTNNRQMANRLSHPSPPPAINTSPQQQQPLRPSQQQHHHQQQHRSPSPIQHSPQQQQQQRVQNNTNNHANMGGYSPQSTSSNSSYLTSPRGTPNASPHVSPQQQGRQFRSRYDQRMMSNLVREGGLFAQQQQQQRLVQQQSSRRGGGGGIINHNNMMSQPPLINQQYQQQQQQTTSPIVNNNNNNNNNVPTTSSNNNNRGAFDHNKARFMKAAMQNLAHVISPMNLDNPALNKRLIEERRRAREERRKKIRKSRRNRR